MDSVLHMKQLVWSVSLALVLFISTSTGARVMPRTSRMSKTRGATTAWTPVSEGVGYRKLNASVRMSPQLTKSCGPGQLSGSTDMGSKLGNWLQWSQMRSGTACRHVHFMAPFPTGNDIRLFLTADRTECNDLSSHPTPVVWAENVHRDGFEACVHFLAAAPSAEARFWQERLQIAWWAIDSKLPALLHRTHLSQSSNRLPRNRSICRELPSGAHVNSNTVLLSTAHPGLTYRRSYTYQRPTHTPREAVLSWLEERNRGQFLACTTRLADAAPDEIEEAGMSVASFGRNASHSGLAGVQLHGAQRGCVRVAVNLARLPLSVAHEASRGNAEARAALVFVQARLDRAERREDGEYPVVSAWVEQKRRHGFTACAKQVGRLGVRTRRSVHVHWIAVRQFADGDVERVCREGVR